MTAATTSISPDLQAAISMNGEVLQNALVYLTGSHMFGLQTAASDEDYTIIYWDADDDRRVFRRFPDAQHSADNNHKLYSLRKFGILLAKGNPNACEMLNLEPAYQYGWELTEGQLGVAALMVAARPHIVTRQLVSAYLGHLKQLLSEIRRGKLTDGKRLAHGLRLAYSARSVMADRQLSDFRTNSARDVALRIKTGEIPLSEATELLEILDHGLTVEYNDARGTLPDGSELQRAINAYFIAGCRP